MKKVDFKSRKLFPCFFSCSVLSRPAPKSWHYFSDLKNDNLLQCITMIEFFFVARYFLLFTEKLGQEKKLKLMYIFCRCCCCAFALPLRFPGQHPALNLNGLLFFAVFQIIRLYGFLSKSIHSINNFNDISIWTMALKRQKLLLIRFASNLHSSDS